MSTPTSPQLIPSHLPSSQSTLLSRLILLALRRPFLIAAGGVVLAIVVGQWCKRHPRIVIAGTGVGVYLAYKHFTPSPGAPSLDLPPDKSKLLTSIQSQQRITKSAALEDDVQTSDPFTSTSATPSPSLEEPEAISQPRREALAMGPFDLPDTDELIRFAQPAAGQPKPESPTDKEFPPDRKESKRESGSSFLLNLPPLPSPTGISPRVSTHALGDLPSTSPTSTDPFATTPVRSATVLKLVERLTLHQIPDAAYTSAFFSTYPSFVKPDVLLELLIRRYEEAPPEPSGVTQLEMRRRAVTVLGVWVATSWKDFADSFSLLDRLKQFLAQEALSESSIARKAADLSAQIRERENTAVASVHARQRAVVVDLRHIADPPSLVPASSLPTVLLDPTSVPHKALALFAQVDPTKLAGQITLIQDKLFSLIRREELMDQRFSKKGKETAAPNVRATVAGFNRLARAVATSVLYIGGSVGEPSTPTTRAGLVKHWIAVAGALLALRNFDSCLAVISALESAPVSRLARTWRHVGEKHRDRLKDMTDTLSPRSNYSLYRQAFSAAPLPKVPYLGVHLTELTFVDDGNPDSVVVVGRAHVNFSKRVLNARILAGILQCQMRRYGEKEVEPDPQVQRCVVEAYAAGVDREDAVWERSLEMEPRVE